MNYFAGRPYKEINSLSLLEAISDINPAIVTDRNNERKMLFINQILNYVFANAVCFSRSDSILRILGPSRKTSPQSLQTEPLIFSTFTFRPARGIVLDSLVSVMVPPQLHFFVLESRFINRFQK